MLHRELNLLVPAMQNRAQNALDEMRTDQELKSLLVDGIFVNETKRDLEVQMAYYTKGRLSPSDTRCYYQAAGLNPPGVEECTKPCTWTLRSKHLEGKAIDLVPIRAGAPWWGAPASVWKRMGAIGKSHGLQWGGDWKKKEDCPHFEMA